MKKSNPQIITEFFDDLIASGQRFITCKEIVQRTGVKSHNVSCILQQLKSGRQYSISVADDSGNATIWKITHASKSAQLINSVSASKNMITAWRRIAKHADYRVYMPAFWPKVSAR